MNRGRRKGEIVRKNRIFLFIFCLLVLEGTSLAGNNKEELTVLTGQSLKLSGFTQVRYTHWQEGIDGFRMRRARVGLKGEILKNINYRLQIDALKSPVLLDAQIEIEFIPHARLRFGQFKVPFSLENLTSSSALDTINRSLTVEKLCPGRDIGANGRDIGVAVNGQFSRIECFLGVFNGSGINKTDFNDQKDIAGRFVFYPGSSLTLGLSHYNGRYSSHPGASVVERNRTGIDMFFIKDQLSVKGEYIFARDAQIESYAWYLQGGCYIMPEKLQAIVKYDSFDKNLDIQGDRISVMTLGLNWFFSEKTKFQINYEYHREDTNETSKNVILAQLQAGF